MDPLTYIIYTLWEGLGLIVSNSSFFTAIAAEWQLLTDSRAPLLLVSSAICGTLMGLEREFAGKPAGLRTNILISVGSTLFTLASIYSWQHVAGAPPTVDPGRIAAQVVTGVGFIGAGVILRTGLTVSGITTAATIWLVSATGVVTGLGFPLLGILVSIAATVALFFLGRIERRFPKGPQEE